MISLCVIIVVLLMIVSLFESTISLILSKKVNNYKAIGGPLVVTLAFFLSFAYKLKEIPGVKVFTENLLSMLNTEVNFMADFTLPMFIITVIESSVFYFIIHHYR